MLDTIRAVDIGPPRNGAVYLREEPRGPLIGEALKEHEKETAAFRSKGLLVKPCPECGSRVTFAESMAGDQPVTLDLRLLAKAA
jgi:hypothetical protein